MNQPPQRSWQFRHVFLWIVAFLNSFLWVVEGAPLLSLTETINLFPQLVLEDSQICLFSWYAARTQMTFTMPPDTLLTLMTIDHSSISRTTGFGISFRNVLSNHIYIAPQDGVMYRYEHDKSRACVMKSST